MDIKLATDIKDLLLEDGSISIPDFGGFTSAYKPAVVDAMNGQLAPPSYHIAFDANLQMNDGRLVDYIRQKYRISSTAALEYIEVFTNDARKNFDKGEIIVLPEIGRLYRDFAQKIQFLPDATNFNTDSFGLPNISFAPVLRDKIESITRATSTDSTPLPDSSAPQIRTSDSPQNEVPSPSVSTQISASEPEKMPKSEPILPQSQPSASEQKTTTIESLAGRNEPIFPSSIDSVKPLTWTKSDEILEKMRENWRTWVPIGAVVTIIGLLVWQLSDTSKPKYTEGSKKTRTAEPNINTSPLQGSAAEPNVNVAPPINDAKTQVPDNQQVTPTISTPEVVETPQTGQTANQEANSGLSNASHKATVLLGGFADKRNIQKNKAWIESKGYAVLERKSGGLTLLSCEVGYETRTDLQKTMRQLRGKFGNEISITRK
jgi:CCDC81-like prokaryotic HU domain 2/CCDC81-like prokaryotic HU domain 1